MAFLSDSLTAQCGGFTVSETDRLFVTAMQFGRMISEFSFSGITSIASLIKAVVERLGAITGVVTLNLRNGSKGQSMKKVVRLRGESNDFGKIEKVCRTAVADVPQAQSPRLPEATQLCFAF